MSAAQTEAPKPPVTAAERAELLARIEAALRRAEKLKASLAVRPC